MWALGSKVVLHLRVYIHDTSICYQFMIGRVDCVVGQWDDEAGFNLVASVHNMCSSNCFTKVGNH